MRSRPVWLTQVCIAFAGIPRLPTLVDGFDNSGAMATRSRGQSGSVRQSSARGDTASYLRRLNSLMESMERGEDRPSGTFVSSFGTEFSSRSVAGSALAPDAPRRSRSSPQSLEPLVADEALLSRVPSPGATIDMQPCSVSLPSALPADGPQQSSLARHSMARAPLGSEDEGEGFTSRPPPRCAVEQPSPTVTRRTRIQDALVNRHFGGRVHLRKRLVQGPLAREDTEEVKFALAVEEEQREAPSPLDERVDEYGLQTLSRPSGCSGVCLRFWCPSCAPTKQRSRPESATSQSRPASPAQGKGQPPGVMSSFLDDLGRNFLDDRWLTGDDPYGTRVWDIVEGVFLSGVKRGAQLPNVPLWEHVVRLPKLRVYDDAEDPNGLSVEGSNRFVPSIITVEEEEQDVHLSVNIDVLLGLTGPIILMVFWAVNMLGLIVEPLILAAAVVTLAVEGDPAAHPCSLGGLSIQQWQAAKAVITLLYIALRFAVHRKCVSYYRVAQRTRKEYKRTMDTGATPPACAPRMPWCRLPEYSRWHVLGPHQ